MEPFLAWPESKVLKRNIALSLVLTALWLATYGAASYITGLHETRWRVHMDWELGIPFLAPFAAVYISINLLMPLAPFILRTEEEFLRLYKAMRVEMLVAVVFFLLLPARLMFPPPVVEGFWAPFFRFADVCNLNHNLLPSLHVAFALTCAAAYAKKRGPLGKTLLKFWAWLVCAATLFTHQHHVADVVAGAALAWGVNRRYLV
ncbi:MAG: phosphatase PAP2 family protein [Elusimicrobia bacterium]|nr:phosphatase PAP2 family protein [Elusimicrobiota bacterium]